MRILTRRRVFTAGLLITFLLIVSWPIATWVHSQSRKALDAPNQSVQTLPKFVVSPKSWSLTNTSTTSVDDIQASAVILIDVKSGHILAQRQAHQQRPIASVTKIMTAALVLEFAKPDSLVTIPKSALNGLPTDSAVMGISTGEQYTIKELLYGMLLPSGNDAAQALALAIAGSQQNFANLMNAKAKQLGLKDTHFTNASGLDQAGHYSSAYDLAILTHYAQTFPIFNSIVDTPTKNLPYSPQHKALELINANTFISSYPGATGVKPGNTELAGNCLVASATRDGHSLIGVLLNTPGRNTSMAKLFDRGFANLP